MKHAECIDGNIRQPNSTDITDVPEMIPETDISSSPFEFETLLTSPVGSSCDFTPTPHSKPGRLTQGRAAGIKKPTKTKD